MAKRKKELVKAVAVEQLSRNPRRSRQSKTRSGKPIIKTTYSVEDIREALGISQAQLANAAGIPRAAIANVESERYVLSANNGIKLFVALAHIASPQSPQFHQARQAALELDVFQKELDRQGRISAKGQIKLAKNKLKEIESREAAINSEIAWLRGEN